MTGFYYLASPYSKYPHGLQTAFDDTVRQVGFLLRHGIYVYSPIVHQHYVARLCGIDPRDHAIWIPADQPLMDAARGLIVCKLAGWEESKGIAEERKIFEAAHKAVISMQPFCVPPGL